MLFNRDYTPRPKPEKTPKKSPRPLSRKSKKADSREKVSGEISFNNSTIKKKPRKASGEKIVFEMIWNERPHICQVTGEPIFKFDPWCFMHILAKGPFPRFKLRKDNIYLVTRWVHTEYDDGDRSHEMFDEVREKAEKLKLEYYSK